MTTLCLADLGLERLELVHAMGNEGSCRVATRAHFPLEGIKRRGTRHTDGRRDMHLVRWLRQGRTGMPTLARSARHT